MSLRASLLRERAGHGHEKVTTVELFFDLVFVFAVTQLSHSLLEDFSLLGGFKTLLLTLGVWWVWIYTSWVTNWLDPDKTPTRLLLLVLMLAGLILSASIPEAFEHRAASFACAYVFMQVGRTLYFLWAVAGHPTMVANFQRILVWLLLSAVFWLAGAWFDAWRLPLWVVALAVEFISPSLGFYVPRLGRSRTSDWDVEGGHLSERCGLFVIIALGESILVTGATFAKLQWDAATIAAFVSAFVGSLAMWWIYFDAAADSGTTQIVESKDPGRLARVTYTYIHLLIVAGIIVSAVGDEFLLAHPLGHASTPATVAVIGGAVLYLVGNSLFKFSISGKLPYSHVSGAVGLAAAAGLSPWLPPLALGATTAAILLGVAAWDAHRNRGWTPAEEEAEAESSSEA
ncbi:MAG TPA: low temperature requirement protein A [Tahibacter sp.]|uniref:low temperature requirement protein A n=1 Tax=Tahibacter sp. TaxID=2056211 RepID=UPI002CB31A48|nr:low temperature requirement protein A [Tahibacter sp.]HSX58614.1 low temperature requirement protein A [Tahibacter sp.]